MPDMDERNETLAAIVSAGAVSVARSPVEVTARRPAAPFVEFEALVLQTFIQSMLPKDAETVYGKGLSGEMWQAMLAEKIASQVTQRGGIGIAARLAKDYGSSAVE
jgi:peptidoglycan hydrolase FlgJ